MRPDDILDAIGQVDDTCVQQARQKRNLWKTAGVTAGALAACFLAVFLLLPEGEDQPDQPSQPVHAETAIGEAAILEENVWIYYVDGQTIAREERFLPCQPRDIFAAWKEKNRIGDEVELIRVHIDSNSTTTVREFEGMSLVEHKLGDYFILNLTVSANLEDYYDAVDPDLLLDSLQQTMSGYSSMEYDEYHLILE